MTARIGPRAARIDTPGTKNTNSQETSVDKPAAREAVAKLSIRCRTSSEGGEGRDATPRRFERCPATGWLLLSRAEVHHPHHVGDEHHDQSEGRAENAHCLRSLTESRGTRNRRSQRSELNGPPAHQLAPARETPDRTAERYPPPSTPSTPSATRRRAPRKGTPPARAPHRLPPPPL